MHRLDDIILRLAYASTSTAHHGEEEYHAEHHAAALREGVRERESPGAHAGGEKDEDGGGYGTLGGRRPGQTERAQHSTTTDVQRLHPAILNGVPQFWLCYFHTVKDGHLDVRSTLLQWCCIWPCGQQLEWAWFVCAGSSDCGVRLEDMPGRLRRKLLIPGSVCVYV